MAAILMPRTFARGVLIFHKDGPRDVRYIIKSGHVRICLPADDGEEMTLNVYGPGDIFGEMSLLDGRGRSASAMALEPATVLTLAREDLDRQIATAPPMVRALLNLLVQRLRYTSSHAESLAFLGVNGRVAARLLELADCHAGPDATAGLGSGPGLGPVARTTRSIGWRIRRAARLTRPRTWPFI
jgi:CRP/FNR family transcriptional regulator, cyclic AMP receptor protein